MEYSRAEILALKDKTDGIPFAVPEDCQKILKSSPSPKTSPSKRSPSERFQNRPFRLRGEPGVTTSVFNNAPMSAEEKAILTGYTEQLSQVAMKQKPVFARAKDLGEWEIPRRAPSPPPQAQAASYSSFKVKISAEQLARLPAHLKERFSADEEPPKELQKEPSRRKMPAKLELEFYTSDEEEQIRVKSVARRKARAEASKKPAETKLKITLGSDGKREVQSSSAPKPKEENLTVTVGSNGRREVESSGGRGGEEVQRRDDQQPSGTTIAKEMSPSVQKPVQRIANLENQPPHMPTGLIAPPMMMPPGIHIYPQVLLPLPPPPLLDPLMLSLLPNLLPPPLFVSASPPYCPAPPPIPSPVVQLPPGLVPPGLEPQSAAKEETSSAVKEELRRKMSELVGKPAEVKERKNSGADSSYGSEESGFHSPTTPFNPFAPEFVPSTSSSQEKTAFNPSAPAFVPRRNEFETSLSAGFNPAAPEFIPKSRSPPAEATGPDPSNSPSTFSTERPSTSSSISSNASTITATCWEPSFLHPVLPNETPDVPLELPGDVLYRDGLSVFHRSLHPIHFSPNEIISGPSTPRSTSPAEEEPLLTGVFIRDSAEC